MSRIVLVVYLLCLYYIINNTCSQQKKKNKFFIILASLGLIIDSGLRHMSVGPDTYQYYTKFEETKNYSFEEIYNSIFKIGDYIHLKDPGYHFLMKLFQEVSLSYRLFLILVAVLFFFSLARLIYKNVFELRGIVMSYIFYIGMFWHFFSTTGTRQTIATSVVMLAYPFLFKGSRIIYVALVVLASFIHASAIAALLAVPVLLVKARKVFYFVIVLLIPVVFVERNYIFSLFLENTGLYDLYSIYLETENSASSLIVVSFYLIIFLLCLLFRYQMEKRNGDVDKWMQVYSIGMFFLPAMFIAATAFRVSFYFTVAMYVLVPQIIHSIRLKGIYAWSLLAMMVLMSFSIRKTWDYAFYWESATVRTLERDFVLHESVSPFSGEVFYQDEESNILWQ